MIWEDNHWSNQIKVTQPGKRLHTYGKSTHGFNGRSTIFMAMFSSYVSLPEGMEFHQWVRRRWDVFSMKTVENSGLTMIFSWGFSDETQQDAVGAYYHYHYHHFNRENSDKPLYKWEVCHFQTNPLLWFMIAQRGTADLVWTFKTIERIQHPAA